MGIFACLNPWALALCSAVRELLLEAEAVNAEMDDRLVQDRL